MKVGDKVHYWSRRMPHVKSAGVKTLCHRAVIVEISPDGRLARVERKNSPTAVPVQTVEVKRLKPGWNNWTNPEGRVIE